MTLRVSCPYCNTGFDVAGPTAGRVSCPRCGEAVAVKPPDDGPLPQPSLNGDGVHAVAPTVVEAPVAPSGLRPLLLIAAALFTTVAVGIGVWLGGVFKEPTKDDPVKPPGPRATWPPQTLAGLRYLPDDAQVVFALQPQTLIQYAERTGQDPNKLLADGGMPKQILDWLGEAGIKPGQIDHVAVGVKFVGIPPFAVLLSLREPLKDEGQFLKGLKARRDPDKNVYQVAGGALLVPVFLVKVDDTKYLFASDTALLGSAKKPSDGIGHFRKELQDSIQKLSPAAFFWLATDSHDWKANPSLNVLAAAGLKADDLWKRFDPRLRATAIGLSLDGELQVRVAARYLDAPTATEREKGWKELLAASKGESAVEGVWATASVPLNPTDACGKVLKRVFTP